MATRETKKDALPDFSKMILDEIARFWETHDSADYWDQLDDVTDQVAFARPRATVSIRITEEDLTALKQIAAERGLGPTALLRAWVKEKLDEVRN